VKFGRMGVLHWQPHPMGRVASTPFIFICRIEMAPWPSAYVFWFQDFLFIRNGIGSIDLDDDRIEWLDDE
jgi:hypothetical protein